MQSKIHLTKNVPLPVRYLQFLAPPLYQKVSHAMQQQKMVLVLHGIYVVFDAHNTRVGTNF